MLRDYLKANNTIVEADGIYDQEINVRLNMELIILFLRHKPGDGLLGTPNYTSEKQNFNNQNTASGLI